MIIGLFGGSFSPVHWGHYQVVVQLLDAKAVDRIEVIPAFLNPFKQDQPPLPEPIRLAMLAATFQELGQVGINRIELDRAGLSYSYETLEAFAQAYPSDQLYLILGADTFASFHQWKRTDRVLELARLLVVRRRASQTPDLARSKALVGDKLLWMDLDLPQVSSTEIRSMSADELKTKPWLHPKALEVWLQQPSIYK